jgi:hypothetical protein
MEITRGGPTAAIPCEDSASCKVSDLFFSHVNISALQQGIRYKVYVESSGVHKINNQSQDELGAIMRSIYINYSRNLPFDYIGQVKQLNERVLDYAVPRIVTEANMRLHYLKDIDSPLPVLPPAVATSVAGSKTEQLAFTLL